MEQEQKPAGGEPIAQSASAQTQKSNGGKIVPIYRRSDCWIGDHYCGRRIFRL